MPRVVLAGSRSSFSTSRQNIFPPAITIERALFGTLFDTFITPIIHQLTILTIRPPFTSSHRPPLQV